jgi:hypothetical protein
MAKGSAFTTVERLELMAYGLSPEIAAEHRDRFQILHRYTYRNVFSQNTQHNGEKNNELDSKLCCDPTE